MSDGHDETPTPAPAKRPAIDSAHVRAYVARAVWVVCLTIALILAVAAFSWALNANPDNSLIKLVRNIADHCDLGWFDLNNPIWRGTGNNAQTKTALANYGVAAVVYMVIGRSLERIIRP